MAVNYFEEKQQQVDPQSFVAFGIVVHSRYGKSSEICEMINFSEAVARAGVLQYIEEVFYDSKACLCNIKVTDSLQNDSLESNLIRDCAEKTISQFDWDGIVFHGEPMKKRIENII